MTTQNDYNAASIKILREEEASDAFTWLLEGNLATEYGVPLSFVQRGMEASRILCIPPDYFIGKYLKKDLSIATMPEFGEVYAELLKKERSNNWKPQSAGARKDSDGEKKND
uniref:hypothetical protein n=1 Tax=Thaumasiovibrio occultus TaxID=1891184 RepID=UPI000B361323|nr:hypothetical protein [Thaumasiovibrio occultus]